MGDDGQAWFQLRPGLHDRGQGGRGGVVAESGGSLRTWGQSLGSFEMGLERVGDWTGV